MEDKKRANEEKLAMVEYLASFWNPEGVKKIKEARESAEMHAFDSDDKFEELLKSGAYKDNPVVNEIQKNTNLNTNNTEVDHRDKRSLGLPDNIADIHNLVGD